MSRYIKYNLYQEKYVFCLVVSVSPYGDSKIFFVPCLWQEEKHLSLFLYQAQNLPSSLLHLQTCIKLPNWYSKYISYPKSILTAFFTLFLLCNVSIVIIFAIYHVDYSWWIIQKKFVKGKSVLHAYVFYRMKIFTMQIQEKSIITYFCISEEDIMKSKSNGFYWFSNQQNKLHNSP